MKLFDRIPRLSRRQRLARNLTVTAVCLFLLAWMMEFPCLSRAALLRRVERMCLLKNTELLHDGRRDDEAVASWSTLYARNGDTLLAIRYSTTPLGLKMDVVDLYQEPDNIHCFKRMWFSSEPFAAMAFGDLEAADRAVLEYPVRVTTGVGDVKRTLLQETYIAEGRRCAPGAFLFQLHPHYGEDDVSPEAVTERKLFAGEVVVEELNPVLRLYDGNGRLFHEKTMEYLPEETYAW